MRGKWEVPRRHGAGRSALRRLRAVCGLSLFCPLLLAFPGSGAEEPPAPGESAAAPALRIDGDVATIVAIGDVHGALGALRALLRSLELVDEAGDWIGGRTVVVQTGDLVDRGDSMLEVLGWIRRLQPQAEAAGGRFHVLMGNHEAMNLIGDYRDLTTVLLRPLVDDRSEKRRTERCKEEIPIRREQARHEGLERLSTALARNQCTADHPLGLIEYAERIGPDAPLGRWLRSLPAVLVLGDTLFVHGGISGALASETVESVNARIRKELAVLDAAREWLRETGRATASVRFAAAVRESRWLVDQQLAGRGRIPEPVEALARIEEWWLIDAEGPLWFRGWSREEDAATEEELAAVLEGWGVRRMVVGHTPQKSGKIVSRYDGRVFAIDTGMLTAVYRGAPAALVLRGGRVEAHYLDGTFRFTPDPGQASEAELEDGTRSTAGEPRRRPDVSSVPAPSPSRARDRNPR